MCNQERAAILSTAVGIARLYLSKDRVEEAKDVLDSAAAETHRLHWTMLIDEGYPEDTVDQFLGPRRDPTPRPNLVDSLDEIQTKAEMTMLTFTTDPVAQRIADDLVYPMCQDIIGLIAELREARS